MRFTTKNIIGLLSFLVGLELAIGSGQLKVTANMFPAAWLPAIEDWAAALAVIGAAAIGFVSRSLPDAPPASAAQPGASVAAKTAAAIALMIGLGFSTLLSAGGTAHAQTIKTPAQMFADIQARLDKLQSGLPAAKTPSQVATDIQTQVAEFEKVTIADFQAAQKIYEAANNLNGMNCNGQLLKVAQANAIVNAGAPSAGAPSDGATPAATPGVIAILAKAYNLHVAFQTGSPTRAQCAAMKDDIQNSTSPLLSAAGVTKLLPFLSMIGL